MKLLVYRTYHVLGMLALLALHLMESLEWVLALEPLDVVLILRLVLDGMNQVVYPVTILTEGIVLGVGQIVQF